MTHRLGIMSEELGEREERTEMNDLQKVGKNHPPPASCSEHVEADLMVSPLHCCDIKMLSSPVLKSCCHEPSSALCCLSSRIPPNTDHPEIQKLKN